MDRIVSMEVFVSTVGLGSLTAASEALGMSRSMATRHITALEKSLGVCLLYRSTRSLGITNAGRDLLPFCQNILEQNAQLYSLAQEQQSQPKGRISLVTSISFGQGYLAQAIEQFMLKYPDIEVDLTLSNQSLDLIKHGVDMAIELSNELPESLIGKKLADCPSVVCASSQYLAEHGTPLSPEDLRDHNCLIHKRIGHDWLFVPKVASKSAQPVNVTATSNYSVNDSSILLDATTNGKGLACLPLPLIVNDIQAGTLTVLLKDFEVNPIGIWALYPSRQYQPKLHRLLLDFLQEDLSIKHRAYA
ncbi:LysR family transcriptional regulator [Photobacterium damselae subsp. damselae]|uniref:LysR family transcriptional regulator n=1 Tax=Photobacterium damselae subsp. damselae TaxID=85581 RepID=A0AAD3WVC4_PHODD|nr:LysR family transcriptional regulator [Photobacterium damselae]KAB1176611.1 LysR family transcriptional regulator [Photobacterium damselae subsp. damselae]MBE8127655.1 LysR family transcriptional regulator [Photobacterium damselae subsp. piscicida]NVO59615.1 LysR family transcriptional regulator [Photobacterium damselae subsp. damselae]PSB81775.1 LysR family transcriptional regulator [Photobacterium damselae subsp. damselae]WIH21924.1 LysR family transcriptional regulator [Photobacterium da